MLNLRTLAVSLVYPTLAALSLGFTRIGELSRLGLWLPVLCAFDIATWLYYPLSLYWGVGKQSTNTLVLLFGTYICLSLAFFHPRFISFLRSGGPYLLIIIAMITLAITYIVLHVIYRSLFNLLRYRITAEVEDGTWFGYWDRVLVSISQIIPDTARDIYQTTTQTVEQNFEATLEILQSLKQGVI